jgi:hypothetical protein
VDSLNNVEEVPKGGSEMSGAKRMRVRRLVLAGAAAALCALVAAGIVASSRASGSSVEKRVNTLLAKMTLDEKLEQLQLEADWQVNDAEARKGVGGVFSLTDPERINHLQHVAVEESRPVRVRHHPRLPHRLPDPAGRGEQLRPGRRKS